MRAEKYTIGDVARMLGVSRSTVSRALSGSQGVSTELRQRIIAFTEEIGYKPSPVAQSLSTGVLKSIGLVIGDVRNPFYADLTYHIQKYFNSRGYSVMIFNSEYDVQKEIEFIGMAEQLYLAGMLLFTAQTTMVKEIFGKFNIPIVLVNRTLPMDNYDCVLIDNYKAGYMAAKHLIDLGHTRIGIITGDALSSASAQRREGARQAIINYGLPMREEDLLSGDLKMGTGYSLAREIFTREDRPTAMVVGNDLMAFGFMDFCKEKNVRIPQEMSIVSFDNIAFSAIHGIELTTINQHVKDMGERAAELMVRRIERPESSFQRVILEPTLIVRNSTAAPKKKS